MLCFLCAANYAFGSPQRGKLEQKLVFFHPFCRLSVAPISPINMEPMNVTDGTGKEEFVEKSAYDL